MPNFEYLNAVVLLTWGNSDAACHEADLYVAGVDANVNMNNYVSGSASLSSECLHFDDISDCDDTGTLFSSAFSSTLGHELLHCTILQESLMWTEKLSVVSLLNQKPKTIKTSPRFAKAV